MSTSTTPIYYPNNKRTFSQALGPNLTGGVSGIIGLNSLLTGETLQSPSVAGTLSLSTSAGILWANSSTGNFDMHNSSGTFSTGSGNVSINGNIITNINQTGATTLSTGTGNISLNGNIITNIAQTGSTTFGTGTGTVSLNGNTTLASGKALSLSGNISQTGSTTLSTGTGNISLNGNITNYNGYTTSGNGIPIIVANGLLTAQTTNQPIFSYTTPSSGTVGYILYCQMDMTSYTSGSMQIQASYIRISTGTALTFPIEGQVGTSAQNSLSAVNSWSSYPIFFRPQANTTVVLSIIGTYSAIYTASAYLVQLTNANA